ncbi:lipocalin family protein [Bacteriovorax sp. Seq25_V]|uniref:lipocalin family protein n=1 Tax=Bacteriovorax sp. Seq25_V TaxID=1201288 RepID=UPI00038A000A|nr:lipocalin family protein [Bacteriovorax sp. Seq25_V]EQC48001.1 lipocalin-like protein [Bacteriovorax sp. Seq25_V]
MKTLLVMVAFVSQTLCFAAKQLPTVSQVEVERYVGKWNAVAALPQRFTKKCIAQTADYELIGEGTVSVLNTCIKKHGKTKTIEGKAVVKNKLTNASLEVTFDNFWTKLFRVKGDYQILKLDENYEYVLVGSNNKKSLWIMSRETSMPAEVFQEYVDYAKTLGFETSELVISKF